MSFDQDMDHAAVPLDRDALIQTGNGLGHVNDTEFAAAT
jgi:hypothetical protein